MKPIDILIRGSYVMIRLVVIALVFSIADSYVDTIRVENPIAAFVINTALIAAIIDLLISPFLTECIEMLREQRKIDKAKK